MMENPIPVSDTPGAPEPKKSRTGLIIGIVIVVLCCCCLIVGSMGAKWLWDNGDQLLQQLSFLANTL
jgi:hypothetical protein